MLRAFNPARQAVGNSLIEIAQNYFVRLAWDQLENYTLDQLESFREHLVDASRQGAEVATNLLRVGVERGIDYASQICTTENFIALSNALNQPEVGSFQHTTQNLARSLQRQADQLADRNDNRKHLAEASEQDISTDIPEDTENTIQETEQETGVNPMSSEIVSNSGAGTGGAAQKIVKQRNLHGADGEADPYKIPPYKIQSMRLYPDVVVPCVRRFHFRVAIPLGDYNEMLRYANTLTLPRGADVLTYTPNWVRPQMVSLPGQYYFPMFTICLNDVRRWLESAPVDCLRADEYPVTESAGLLVPSTAFYQRQLLPTEWDYYSSRFKYFKTLSSSFSFDCSAEGVTGVFELPWVSLTQETAAVNANGGEPVPKLYKNNPMSFAATFESNDVTDLCDNFNYIPKVRDWLTNGGDIFTDKESLTCITKADLIRSPRAKTLADGKVITPNYGNNGVITGGSSKDVKLQIDWSPESTAIDPTKDTFQSPVWYRTEQEYNNPNKEYATIYATPETATFLQPGVKGYDIMWVNVAAEVTHMVHFRDMKNNVIREETGIAPSRNGPTSNP